MSDANWTRLDASTIQQLYTSFITDGIAPACLRALESRLLASGILFTSKDFSKTTDQAFQTHINHFFTKFVRDALLQLTVCGFAFFVIEDSIPRVIPLGLADIRWRINTRKFTIDMAVFREGEEHPDPNIFAVIENTVDSSGNPLSCMSSYLRSRQLLDSFVRNALTADALNARPPIYTTQVTDAVFDERDMANVGEVDGYKASHVGADMRNRTRLAVGTHAYNEDLVRMMNTRPPEVVQDERTDKQTGLPNYDANSAEVSQTVIPLPLDTKPVDVPRATARADIISISQHYENLACVAFGVNQESIGANLRVGAAGSADALEKANLVTAETTARWARLFEPILIKIYETVWGDNHVEEEDEAAEEETETEQQPRRKKKKVETMPNSDIAVVFPSTLSSSMVERLFVSRVLSYPAYCRYISNVLQFPTSSFEKTDHRLALLGEGPKGGDFKSSAPGGLGGV